MLTLDQIDRLIGGRLGTFDIACPVCGPERRSPANQRRKVLRIWRTAPGFATFRCARCDLYGFARDSDTTKPDAAELAKARVEARRFGEAAAEERRGKARWLWKRRLPAAGTVVETYLRGARNYTGPLPPTIGFLPPHGELAPAMITAFGFYADMEGPVPAESIQAVHVTRLAPDGSGKAGTATDKIMIGAPRGFPIVLAPISDSLGLAITEGIEDGLSIFEATGLGVWGAGSASFLPALAAAVPSYIDVVNIVADPDEAGRRFARQLALGLRERGIRYRLVIWRDQKMVRAA
jgi:Toprim domain